MERQRSGRVSCSGSARENRRRVWYVVLVLGSFPVGGWGQQSNSDLALPSATLVSGGIFYQAPNSITNTADFTVKGAANVTFTAGNVIRLEPGFHATGGSASPTFHAQISPAAQTAPISISSQPPPASAPSQEYIYLNGRVVAMENAH